MDERCAKRFTVLERHVVPSALVVSPHRHLHHHLLDNRCNGLTNSGSPVLIGGMVLDIHAVPFSEELRRGTTTPGRVRYVQGGVARNVAECMEKLGTAPFLISVVGEDTAGDLLVAHWQSLGLSIDGIRRCAGVTTPIVSAIFDGKGELAGAVADVHAVEEYLTPEWINQFGEAVRSARVLMLDANLNPAALEAACRLAKMANVPTWFEPVSVTKSIRIKTIAPHVTFTSPNEAELIAMANSLCSNTQDKCLLSGVVEDSCQKSIIEMVQDLKAAILAVLESGIKYIALTLGKHGVVLCSADLYNLPKFQCWSKEMAKAPNKNSYRCSEENMPCKISLKKSLEGCQKLNLHGYKISESWINDPRTNEDCDVRDAGPTGFCSNYNQNSSSSELDLSFVHFPALPASIVSLTGAGDCFVAGVLTGFCMHKDILSSIAYGVAAAKHVVQSDLNVPPVIFEPVLAGDAYRVLVSATKLYIPGLSL